MNIKRDETKILVNYEVNLRLTYGSKAQYFYKPKWPIGSTLISGLCCVKRIIVGKLILNGVKITLNQFVLSPFFPGCMGGDQISHTLGPSLIVPFFRISEPIFTNKKLFFVRVELFREGKTTSDVHLFSCLHSVVRSTSFDRTCCNVDTHKTASLFFSCQGL